MRAADLAANLPDDAMVWGRLDERAQWGVERHLMANIADSVAFIAWTKTKDAQRANATWHGQVPRPGFTARPDAGMKTMDPQSMARMLALPRGTPAED